MEIEILSKYIFGKIINIKKAHKSNYERAIRWYGNRLSRLAKKKKKEPTENWIGISLHT